jgi:2-dehydropantoate 2-reductase
MRVAVIGAGAMGSIFGAALARSGAEVAFGDNRAAQVEAIARDGLSVEGVLGPFHLRPRASLAAAALGPADCALILVDANATPAAAQAAKACLAPGGFALTLQNGIGNIEALTEVLGAARVLAGSTYNSGAALGPGRALHSNAGPTAIGELDGRSTDRVRDIATRFTAAGLPTTVSDNIIGVVWSKFVHNCAINPVSALTGLRPGEIARDPAAAKLLERLLDELLAVVERAGIHLPEHDPRGEIYDHAWERYNRPSMLQHVESGRATEIDALNGALVRRARALGMTVPVNEAVALAVKALEAGRRLRAAARDLDEAGMEAAARADPRRGRWGGV